MKRPSLDNLEEFNKYLDEMGAQLDREERENEALAVLDKLYYDDLEKRLQAMEKEAARETDTIEMTASWMDAETLALAKEVEELRRKRDEEKKRNGGT